jgi:serine/threonine-protein kinase
MSHVYRAQDTVLNRTVAVKILTDQGCSDPETKARFLHEARMAGNFAHDNIIRVFDFGEDEGRPFMIMEFLRGETLRDAIKNKRTGNLKTRLRIAYQITQALQYIHTQKIVHRDIKPDNVHIDATGRVKLMDFGIAKSQSVSLTRAGFTLGTPYYMAPEQVLGQNVTHLVDVYAFGVLLYELIAGTKGVTADSIDKVFQQILNEPLQMEPVRQAGAPPSVRDLIHSLTAKNPQDRPQSFEEVGAELDRILKGMDTMDIPVSTGTGTGMTAAAKTGSGSFQMPAPPPPPPPAPRPVTVPRTPVTPAPAATLPAFMQKLPPRFHTQEWFIAIVALGVLFGITIVGGLLSALVRLLR